MDSDARLQADAVPAVPAVPAAVPTPAGTPQVLAPDELPPPRMAPVATTQAWMPAMQSLRGLAALWVVLYHLQVYMDFFALPLLALPGMRFGWLGVDLFFVLSAYLLGQPFLDRRREVQAGRFWMDRFLRIAPPYYAAFLLTAIGYSLFAPDAWIPGKAWWSLLFLQNFRYEAFIAVNPAFWSLAVEMQFYLLLPWMARLFRGKGWPWALAAFTLVSLLYRAVVHEAGDGAQWALQLGGFTLPGFLGHFAVGLAVCRIRMLDAPVGSGVRRGTFAAWIAMVAVPAWLLVPRGSVDFVGLSLAGDTMLRPLAAVGFGLMVLATASGGRVARALAWRPLAWLGGISYSLYLIHIPAQVLALHAISPIENPWGWAGLAFTASVVGGWLLYKGVEAPSELWRRRRKLRQRIAAQAAAASAGPGSPGSG